MTEAVILCALASLLLLVLTLLSGRRRGEPRRTPGQLAVRGLYWWARFWSCVAVAADQAVLHFHLHRQQTPIEPESQYAEAR